MDQDPDAIRRQIEATRASLMEKVRLLEERVRGTVDDAQAGVEKVRATINETMQAVQRAVDLKYQFRKHPWLMLGGCVLAGLAVSSRLKRRRAEPGLPKSEATSAVPSGAHDGALAPESQPTKPGLLRDHFQKEIDLVKGLAIGIAAGYLRDSAKQALPQLAPQIEVVLDSVTVKLGGTPIPGPLVMPFRCTQDSAGNHEAPHSGSVERPPAGPEASGA